MLYFSAHWCPPCRNFTPKLAEWYKANAAKEGCEIVFISSDKNEKDFGDYHKTMGFCALDYADRTNKGTIAKALNVEGIPTLVLYDKSGKLLTKNGRNSVMNGDDFPFSS